MPALHFLNSIENMIIPDLLISSFIHLGVEVYSDAREIVSLHADVKREFGTRNSNWFHPLGLVDGVNVTAKLGSKLVESLQTLLHRHVEQVRVYQPELMHCRTDDLRLQRAACAATVLVSGRWCSLASTKIWIDCISAGLYGVCRQGSVLRFEIVVPYEHLALSPIELRAIRNSIKEFVSNGRTLVTKRNSLQWNQTI